MDKKSKIFFIVFGLLIAASVAVTYWRIMVKKDYVVEAQTDCDPTVDKCFLWECDPESTEEGEACTGDPEEDSWYFQVAKRKAANIPLCDPETDETCDPWTCAENEADCSVEFCTEENIEDQYASACNDPVQYNIDNPAEEEAECEEGDEECEAAAGATCEEGDTECQADQDAASSEEASDESATGDEEAGESKDATTSAFPIDQKAVGAKQ